MKNTNLKKLVTLVLILTTGAQASLATANESVQQLTLSRLQKEQLVQALRETIQRHQAMSQEEILADLKAQGEVGTKSLIEHGASAAQVQVFQSGFEASLQRTAAYDKDTIIALETAHLQEAMTATNFLFGFTKFARLGCGMPFGTHCPSLAEVWPWILLDVVVLPFELFLTGFTELAHMFE